MNIDNQKQYWDKVAEEKIFTHPIDLNLFEKYTHKQSKILDFGCGYGRIVKKLNDSGFTNIVGYDTSKKLIERGIEEYHLPLFQLENPLELPIAQNSIDAIILFAVLTCIPSNRGQIELLKMLYSKLKKGGIIYISDYYLQENSPEFDRYQYFNNDKDNFGVFTLPEGATFRHHTKEWITDLTKDFNALEENEMPVMTMNGHTAKGFQYIGQK